jgi:uncharacterized membrane protein YfcA
MLIDPLLVVAGAGTGLLVGLTGVGGGAVMTPLLLLVFGFAPAAAIGTDLWRLASADRFKAAQPPLTVAAGALLGALVTLTLCGSLLPGWSRRILSMQFRSRFSPGWAT